MICFKEKGKLLYHILCVVYGKTCNCIQIFVDIKMYNTIDIIIWMSI